MQQRSSATLRSDRGALLLLAFVLSIAPAAPGAASERAAAPSQPAAATDESFTRQECRQWIDATYRVAEMADELDLGITDEIDTNRACVERDTERMVEPIPRRWCDNVFKIHCSGLDLLATIGDALVARCEQHLSDVHDLEIASDPVWLTCAEPTIFDRYSQDGEVTDEEVCREIFQTCRSEAAASVAEPPGAPR